MLLGVGFLKSQDPYAVVISKTTGLPSNSVYHIFQDSKGFIWIATGEGLVRYDGYEYKTYVSKAQPSKAGTEISEDKLGRIWYQNFDGFLFYVENDSLKRLNQNEPAGYYHYGIIANKLFVFQKKGIDLYDLRTLTRLKTLPIDVTRIGGTQQTDTYFYFFSDQLHRLDSNGRMTRINVSALEGKKPAALMQKNGNELFMISKYNLDNQCYSITDSMVNEKFRISSQIGHVQNLVYTRDLYWFCTPEGAYAYKGNGAPLKEDTVFFRNKSISFVLKDREDNYWFGTTNEGILFVPDIHISLHKTEYKPNKTVVYKNTLFIGTKKDEIYSLDLNTLESGQIVKGRSNQEVYNLYYDSLSNSLIYTSRDFGVVSLVKKPTITLFSAIKDIQRIDDKYFAYATSGAVGLFALTPQVKTSRSKWDVWKGRSIVTKAPFDIHIMESVRGKSLVYDKTENSIYFATGNGLFRADTNSNQEIKLNGESIYISKLRECAGKIYGLDEQGRLYNIHKDRIELSVLGGETLKQGEIKTIRAAGGFLFLRGATKLFYFRPTGGNPEVKEIPLSIPANEITDLNFWNGKLIICTEQGLLMPGFYQLKRNSSYPLFVINSLKVNGKNSQAAEDRIFNYNENNIEINYSVLCFKNPSDYTLYYKINEGDWEETAKESRTLKLAALSPGEYVISFKIGSHQVSNSVAFKITKPWWTTLWFVALCFFSLLLGLYSYYKWQLGLLKKRNQLLSEKMELEKNLNSSILTSIRSQMNPHFFYNALNTIQSFIFSDDKKNAATYLSKFSKLTRTILEYSEKESISLKEEVTSLTLYLDIEKVRFNNDFDFTVDVDERLDQDLVKFPPMLIQPYVENAIKHGLLHKKENKELRIRFELETGFLKVSIDDNGIGRKRSEELKNIRQATHRSFAASANQKRLEILNKESSTKTAVNFIDKTDQSGNANGTTVIIKIPISIYERSV